LYFMFIHGKKYFVPLLSNKSLVSSLIIIKLKFRYNISNIMLITFDIIIISVLNIVWKCVGVAKGHKYEIYIYHITNI